MPFGPLDEAACGCCSPAMWWLSVTVLATGLGMFCFWTVDYFYYDQASDSIENRARGRVAVAYLGQARLGGSGLAGSGSGSGLWVRIRARVRARIRPTFAHACVFHLDNSSGWAVLPS